MSEPKLPGDLNRPEIEMIDELAERIKASQGGSWYAAYQEAFTRLQPRLAGRNAFLWGEDDPDPRTAPPIKPPQGV